LSGTAETTGGVTNTWTNYTNAGGTQGPSINSGQTVNIVCRLQGFAVADGNTWWYQIGTDPWNGNFYASADAFWNEAPNSTAFVNSPFVDTNVPTCGTPAPPPNTVNETSGGIVHTWTNYTNAGGYQGPDIGANNTVSITCRLQGFTVSDGNNWWYQIGSSPWSNSYYASADPFYNNGATSGSLVGTPFVDLNVPLCNAVASGGSGLAETTGGVTNTWTNYTNAGGSQGPSISSRQTVMIACRLQGFAVADGNTWWYRISSSPWSNSYYASADAFYNNGATSGSLIGTPYYDPNLPIC
jgi:uncharacterized protein YdeI (BOF family)